MYVAATHPIAAFARGLHDELDDLTALDPLYMPTEAKKTALIELEHARHRIAALQMQIMASGGDVTDDGAHRTVADFVSNAARLDRAPLASMEKLGQALADRWQRVCGAALAGQLSPAKARIIVAALDALRGEEAVSAEVLASAEAHLVKIAPEFTEKQLGRLARRVLDVVAPEIGEAAEGRALEREERRAARYVGVSFWARAGGIEGVTEIRIRTTDLIAARLRTHLESLAAPRHLAALGRGRSLEDRAPYTRRLGEAFATLIETLDPQRLPLQGGNATTVMVTIPLAQLTQDLAAASVTGSSEGELRISAGQARRLACNAMIIPAVLGGRSEVLDLGRAQRLFTPAQRRAMAVRDKTCRADGCTIPAAWCEAHHFAAPWSQGGLTNLDHGKLLCPWHHHRAHDNRYVVSEMPNGDVRFNRRR